VGSAVARRQPSCEVASPAKGSPTADDGHSCGGDQWAEAGDLQ
jgi:hypothetical protein